MFHFFRDKPSLRKWREFYSNVGLLCEKKARTWLYGEIFYSVLNYSDDCVVTDVTDTLDTIQRVRFKK
jgi:hypothetical protein